MIETKSTAQDKQDLLEIYNLTCSAQEETQMHGLDSNVIILTKPPGLDHIDPCSHLL